MSRTRGGRPLYARLADQIADEIRHGALSPGDRVASEPELVRRHGVSRATAMRALEHLERSGLVRREQGRGTFVEEPRLVRRDARLGSFSDQVRAHGHVPAHRLLSLGPPVPGGAGTGLEHWFGGADVRELVRLRLVDGEPVGVHTTLLERAVVERAGLDSERLRAEDASLYALLDAAGIHVAEADEHLQAVPAQSGEAELLEVPAGSPLMRVLRVSYGAGGRPIEVVDARYRGDRFDYGVSLVRRHGGGGSTTDRGKEQDAPTHQDAGGIRRDGRAGGRVRQVGRRGLE